MVCKYRKVSVIYIVQLDEGTFFWQIFFLQFKLIRKVEAQKMGTFNDKLKKYILFSEHDKQVHNFFSEEKVQKIFQFKYCVYVVQIVCSPVPWLVYEINTSINQ